MIGKRLLLMAALLLALPASAAVQVTGMGASQTRKVTVSWVNGDSADSSAIENRCAVWRGSLSGASSGASVYALSDGSAAANTGTLLATFSSASAAVTSFETSYPFIKVDVTDDPASGTAYLYLYCALEAGVGGATASIDMTPNGYVTELGIQQIWAGAQPINFDRPGGWKEYYFSSDQVATGDITTVGVDTAACTRAAPCLTKTKMLAMMAPGVKIVLDAGDDWSRAAVDIANFDIPVNTIGCPAGDGVCVWITTTATNKSTTKATWGNTAASAVVNCLEVSDDGTPTGTFQAPREWVYVEGLAVTCDGSNAGATDADAFDSAGNGVRAWFHNVSGTLTGTDGTDNCITAHLGSTTVVTGNPSPQTSLCRTTAAVAGGDTLLALTGGSNIVVISRATIEHLNGANLNATFLVNNACGGVCSADVGNTNPTMVLIGPHITCTGCTATQSNMYEGNPDPVTGFVADSSLMSIYTSWSHTIGAAGSGTGVFRMVLSGAAGQLTNIFAYRNTYLVATSVYQVSGGAIDPASGSMAITDIGSIMDTPEGGAGNIGALFNIGDADWQSSLSATARKFVYDNDDGGGGVDTQCYLEDPDGDINGTTVAGCVSAIAALSPAITSTWSLTDSTLAANQIQNLAGSSTLEYGVCSPTRECKGLVTETVERPFPDGIVLPAIFGAAINGVSLGSGSIATDAGRI